jgi:muconolactone delta-isomerase
MVLTMEYLVTMTTRVPPATTDADVADIRARESARSRELARQGHLLRLWRPPLQPGEWRTLGLFSAAADDELEDVLASMPLRMWRSDKVAPLAPSQRSAQLSRAHGGHCRRVPDDVRGHVPRQRG